MNYRRAENGIMTEDIDFSKNTDITEGKHKLFISVKNTDFMKSAELLAEKLNVDIVIETKKQEKNSDLFLQIDENGLALINGTMKLRGDFTKLIPRIRRSNLQREFLVKASKLKDKSEAPTAVDATAGLGEDSFLIAAAGFSVKLFEYNPVIAALLKDAFVRAGQVPEIADIIKRMELFEEDSIRALPMLSESPDLILLDPMFPERQKSALVKRKLQILQQLERPCGNEEELLHIAIEAHPRKIIIKRPLKGPYLADIKPDYSIMGKAIRYDCLVLAQCKSSTV